MLKNKKIILIFILAIAFFLRSYRINDWLFFGMDQEYEAFIIKNILSLKHFPLIGVNASDTGLYLGPAFIYIAAIPYFLFQGNPLGGAVFASLLGVLTSFMVYQLGKEWFSQNVGLLAGFFWAISFVSVLYDRQFWNPTPLSFLSVVILYSLTKIIQGKKNYLVVLALSLGLALQSHLQAVIFLPIIIFYLLKYRHKYSRNNLFIFLSILFTFQIPLILFDIRHNFTNLRALTALLTGISSSTEIIATTFSERLNILTKMLGRAFYIGTPVDLYIENGQCKELIPFIGQTNILVILIVASSICFYIYKSLEVKSREIKDYKLALSLISITILSILFYNRPLFEYYFLYFLPVIFLMISWIFIYFWRRAYKYFVVTLIIIFALTNAKTFLSATVSYSFRDKISAIKYAKNFVGHNNFSLEALGECGRFGGYRYLFEYFDKRPGSSYMDPYFSWLYGESQSKEFPRKVFFSVIDEREGDISDKWREIEKKESSRMIVRSQFGKIRVMVIDNEKN